MEPSIVVAIITAVATIIAAIVGGYIQLRNKSHENKSNMPKHDEHQISTLLADKKSFHQEYLSSPKAEKTSLWDGLSDTVVIIYGAKHNQDRDKDGHLSLSLRDLNAAQAIHAFLVGKYPKKDYPNKNFILMPGLANGWQTLLNENTDLIVIGGFVVNEEFSRHRSRYQQKLRLKMGRLCHADERHVYHVGLLEGTLRDQPHKIEELSSKFVTQDFAMISRMKVHIYGAIRNVITIAGIKGHGTLGAANFLTSGSNTLELNNISFETNSDLRLELVLKIDVIDNMLDKTEIAEIILNGKPTETYPGGNLDWKDCELSPITNPCKTCTFGEILPKNQTDFLLATKTLNLKGIIFDLDDTLIDTFSMLITPLEVEAAKKMVLTDNSLVDPAKLTSILLELRKKDPSNIEKLLVDEFSIKHGALAKRQTIIENFQKIKFDKLAISAEVKKILQELKDERQLLLFLITEGDNLFQNRKIKHLGIGELFTEISIVPPHKDNKEQIIASLMGKYNLKNNQLLIIGNRLDKEIVAGNKLSIRTVWIRHGEGSNPSSENQNGVPDYILDNVLEVKDVLSDILQN